MGIRDWRTPRPDVSSRFANPQSRIPNPGYSTTHNDAPASAAPMPVAASTSLG